ncbi:hypothetical protein BJV77DRAFT_1036221, partial [Russula vinacea]
MTYRSPLSGTSPRTIMFTVPSTAHLPRITTFHFQCPHRKPTNARPSHESLPPFPTFTFNSV